MNKENKIQENSESKESVKIVRRVGAGDGGSGADKVPMNNSNSALKELLSKLINNSKRRN